MRALPSVLLVDNDDTTNFINEYLLRSAGVTDNILIARNGEEALNTLAQTCGEVRTLCPVLILLDINMPVMNGIDFLEAFMPRPPDEPIVVIALTTTSHPHDLDRLRTLSITDILYKPLTKEKILGILEQYF